MNTARHYETDDLALFAMQLLSRDEMALVRSHVAECQLCRLQVAQLQGDLAVYAMTAEIHSPPAQARERLMKQVAREKKTVPVERPPVPFEQAAAPSRTQRVLTNGDQSGYSKGLGRGRYIEEEEKPKRNVAAMIFPWIGWAVAAGLAVPLGSLYRERDLLRTSMNTQARKIERLNADVASARQLMDAMTDQAAKQVTLTKTAAGPLPPVPQGKVTYQWDKGTLVFTASNMEPLQVYKTYELWLIPADGRDPIPAGTFRPDEHGNASVIMPPLPRGIEAKAFGVTIEDDGGSQTPTMPIVMAGS
jgi:hypothetical protein